MAHHNTSHINKPIIQIAAHATSSVPLIGMSWRPAELEAFPVVVDVGECSPFKALKAVVAAIGVGSDAVALMARRDADAAAELVVKAEMTVVVVISVEVTVVVESARSAHSNNIVMARKQKARAM
ncbi:hypothetical protein OIDMADRAFT_30428 [Oidiodendron maius Zn]|uniref:Uncharacterized protein n=1 Tax=Oidiodendron maius (strain Zn) TaxID=913774 RepID=A0A0C3DDM3_OIDMZ|nr:hypothetical protein OIDMADRAFT_30428 [Oidiodendron maius Zn]